MATERIIVVKAVSEEFSRLLKEAVEKSWSQGAGHAAMKSFSKKAQALVQEAIDEGAKFLVGDNTYLDENQTSLKPTIVTGVSPKSRLYDSESFGPSASLHVVENEEEALDLANSSKYGLSGAIWTQDRLRGIALGKRLECGVVSINDNTLPSASVTTSAQAIKCSGWGAIQSVTGIQEYTILKAIVIQ